MSIALVRATNQYIKGSRIPASHVSNRFRWEGGEGLGLQKSEDWSKTLNDNQYLEVMLKIKLLDSI